MRLAEAERRQSKRMAQIEAERIAWTEISAQKEPAVEYRFGVQTV